MHIRHTRNTALRNVLARYLQAAVSLPLLAGVVCRYFFRKASDEFDSGVVHEELTDDDAPLPLLDGKVIGKVERCQ